MTEDDLAVMELMWLRRIPVKTIAERLGYGVSTIQSYAKMDRERFPRRHRAVNKDAIWPVVREVLEGSKSARDAARELNISEESVMKRVRGLRRQEREDDQDQVQA